MRTSYDYMSDIMDVVEEGVVSHRYMSASHNDCTALFVPHTTLTLLHLRFYQE